MILLFCVLERSIILTNMLDRLNISHLMCSRWSRYRTQLLFYNLTNKIIMIEIIHPNDRNIKHKVKDRSIGGLFFSL